MSLHARYFEVTSDITDDELKSYFSFRYRGIYYIEMRRQVAEHLVATRRNISCATIGEILNINQSTVWSMLHTMQPFSKEVVDRVELNLEFWIKRKEYPYTLSKPLKDGKPFKLIKHESKNGSVEGSESNGYTLTSRKADYGNKSEPEGNKYGPVTPDGITPKRNGSFIGIGIGRADLQRRCYDCCYGLAVFNMEANTEKRD